MPLLTGLERPPRETPEPPALSFRLAQLPLLQGNALPSPSEMAVLAL